MLREVWRLQRDQFWSADLTGVDWNAVWQLYRPLVERVATRADFSDLVWEMQGELGTSHAYEMGGDHRKSPAGALGHLACTTRWDSGAGGWEITRIARGDPWDAAADSPLNAIGVEAAVGERIVAVDGQPLSATLPPEALLVHRAGQKVQLALVRAGGDGRERRREVVVTAIADDVPVHYREWVEKNRAWVHERSGGRVGYFHVPDMQAAGFAEFHRYFGAECERDALIVDVRYNRGGHVSQLLLEKVARRRIAFTHSRWMDVSTYPEEAVAGPVVTLTNEHAGSDGDIFSHCVKLMKIGPLVGTRTWGGVVGIWPRHRLVDGSETTQPEFAFWFTDVGVGVENHGTDPDVEVDNAPQDSAAGRDRQLEVAHKTALDLAAKTSALRAPEAVRPVLRRAPLPPR
jgi:tricorn protease